MIARRALLTAAFGALLLGPAAARDGATRTVRATGAGSAKDRAAARDEAIRDALRRAVEEALGVLVNARTRTENYRLVEDEILTRSAGFVRSYRVLGERAGGADGVYHVEVEADVSLEPLAESVGALAGRIRLGGDPRVAVLLRGGAAAETAESALCAALLERGFTLVDPESADAAARREALHTVLDGEQIDAALSRRLALRADLVIVGTVTARPDGVERIGGETLRAATATCDLSAVHADTGEVVVRRAARSPRQFSGASAEAAVAKATERAAAIWLEAALPALLRAAIDPARRVRVEVRGDPIPPAALAALERRLRALRFARAVRVRERRPGLALYDVDWADGGDFGDRIAEAGALPGFRVVAQTANTLTLRADEIPGRPRPKRKDR